MKTTQLLTTILRWPIIARILLIISFIITFFGAVIHLIEPHNFPTIFDGIWWAIVTTSTVGFGDFVPKTAIGRAVAILLILLGTGFVTSYFITLAASTVTNQNAYIKGNLEYKGNEHVVIIGWNERVKETILQLSTLDTPIKIILIDESLEQHPLPKSDVHFIKGDSSHDEVLIQANISQADMVLITADQNKDEVQADMNSILTLLAIKGLNPNVYSIIEILTSHQVKNAKRAGADEVIQTNRLSSYVMTNSLVSHGMSDTLLTMLDHLKGSKLKYIPAHHDIIGKTFGNGSRKLLEEKILLIGIKRGESTTVNPPLAFEIKKDDFLLVIKD